MELKIYPSKAIKTLLTIIIFLVLANIAMFLWSSMRNVELMFIFGQNDYGPRLVSLFLFGEEINIPTWYASTTLFVCSLLLAIIAFTKNIEGDRYRLHWSALCLIFMFLAIDKFARIHELLNRPLSYLVNPDGIFYSPWVVIGILFVFFFVIAYMKFFMDLPRKTRLLFCLSGVLLVSGALGLELIENCYASTSGGLEDLKYMMMVSLEETLEMLGIAVFIYALLTYIRSYVKEIVLRVSEENQ